MTGPSKNRVAHCKSCYQPIVWLKTAAGRAIPCDADTVPDPTAIFNITLHRSHFATCPNANAHRRPKVDGGSSTAEDAEERGA